MIARLRSWADLLVITTPWLPSESIYVELYTDRSPLPAKDDCTVMERHTAKAAQMILNFVIFHTILSRQIPSMEWAFPIASPLESR